MNTLTLGLNLVILTKDDNTGAGRPGAHVKKRAPDIAEDRCTDYFVLSWMYLQSVTNIRDTPPYSND
ncbi:hypothetical protein VTG60DRAFT_1060 [Thermothelomyces hinnuleus]